MTALKIGDHVEISPHYDLWMRGAMYGTVRKIQEDSAGRKIAVLKMDHYQVRKLVRVFAEDCTVRT